MSQFKKHTFINTATGLLFSTIYYKNSPLDILFFMLGVLESSFLHSPDLDKKGSIPYQNMWLLRPLYKPFTAYGHREVLHNPLWSPVILVLPLETLFQMPMSFWYGMVWGIEVHIILDKVF